MVTILKRGISKKTWQNRINHLKMRRKLDAYKYCGILKINMDPVTIQNALRDEWN